MATDIFRKAYRPLETAEAERLQRIKDLATELYDLLGEPVQLEEVDGGNRLAHPDGRCAAIARTNLEQVVFWGVKSVTG